MLNFIQDLIFPVFCQNCQKEGEYLCPDCLDLIDIPPLNFCPFCSPPRQSLDGKTCPGHQKEKHLDGLFFAASYENPLVKKLIAAFKYPPYVKNLAKTLASLVLRRLQFLEQELAIQNSALIPVPLHKKRQKQRGYNQSEEIAKELALTFKAPLLKDVLIKTKAIQPQMELSKEERKENIKSAFSIKSAEDIKGKKIFLIDDVFTTGSTVEECAKILKEAGAQEVWAITIARD